MPINSTGEIRAKKVGRYAEEYANRTLRDKREIIFRGFYEPVRVPDEMDLDEWMDENFYLPAESSEEHGRWRTKRFEFLRKIAKKLSNNSKCREVGVCKGAQLGFTTLTIGWQGYIAHKYPAPTLFVQPTIDNAREYDEQKFSPSVMECPVLRPILGPDRPKQYSNTKLRKYFAGGYIAFGGGNSPNSLASKSIKNLIIDEEARFPTDLKNEGSAIHLAIRRTANFSESKIYRNSTPTMKETDSIESFCERGTAERYLVACPECNKDLEKYGTWFEIKWKFIKYENNDPESAYLCCPECGSVIEERNKTWMLENGRWFRYNPTPKKAFYSDEQREDLLILIQKEGYHQLNEEQIKYLERTSIDDSDEKKCTFFINSLYSPLGFYSWSDAVESWIEANTKKDKGLLKVFINTVLGETFSYTEGQIEHHTLARRKEVFDPYGNFDIPRDCLTVTMGVDVQKNRLEAHILGHGLYNETWVLDYQVFYGDTAIIGENYMMGNNLTCWGDLKEYLENKFFVHESGNKLKIECTLIDARYNSAQVFMFCKANEHLKAYGVHGTPGWGKGFIERPTKPNKYGVFAFKAMTDELKMEFYTHLRNEVPGPAYVHFNMLVDYPKHYFKGLVIEELKIKRFRHDEILYFENPPGGRNEPLDSYVYGKCALLAMRLNLEGRYLQLNKKHPEKLEPKRKITRRTA